MKKQKIKLSEIKEADFNYNLHPENQIDELKKSLEEFGQFKNIVIWNGQCIAGNGLMLSAQALGWESLDAVIMDDLTEDQAKRLCVADNATPYLARPDSDKLDELLKSLPSIDDLPGVDEGWLEGMGVDLDLLLNDGDDIPNDTPNKLSDNFIVPPFSVLDTRQGYWVERKKTWKRIIGDNADARKNAKSITNQGWTGNTGNGIKKLSEVSILDPVLAEIVNLWFGLPNCKTFDCFAGDTVFGYVSDSMGNSFTGIELRQEQLILTITVFNLKKANTFVMMVKTY